MPFIKMNPTLREDDTRLAYLTQHESPGVPWHRRFRHFSELRVWNAIFRRCVRNKSIQSRAKNDRELRVPSAHPIESRVTHDQAAEIGGADSGFRVPAITSG